jgi:hypothetical protein
MILAMIQTMMMVDDDDQVVSPGGVARQVTPRSRSTWSKWGQGLG